MDVILVSQVLDGFSVLNCVGMLLLHYWLVTKFHSNPTWNGKRIYSLCGVCTLFLRERQQRTIFICDFFNIWGEVSLHPVCNVLYEVLDCPSAGFASISLEISRIHSIFGTNCEPHCRIIASV